MELILSLLALALLAFPIIAIVALVKSVGLREQLRRLEARLAAIERSMSAPAAGPVTAAPTPSPSFAPIPAIAEAPSSPEPEPPPPAPPSAAPPLPPPQVASRPAAMSLEERLGTRWAVWIGGFALALGGIFLVRYSIEQGLLGPRVRVILGALLAAALVVAGEWARRTERLAAISALPAAHIPSVLTAAGTTIAYADIYAAHALYGLLPPALAFLLLGLVALATLAAALLHGPALAGLGLIGAYAAPLLVASDRPDYWSLYIYLAVVTAAAFALARLRTVALARHGGDRIGRRVDLARRRRCQHRGSGRACFPCHDRVCPGRDPDRGGPPVWSRRASPAESTASRRWR